MLGYAVLCRPILATSILPCTSRLANSTSTAFLPSLQSFCFSLASAHSVSAVRFSSPFSSFLVTLNWILAQQTSLSTSAPFSILFILLHCLIWSTPTTLTFSVSLKLGSNPLPPLLNLWTVLLHTTHWLALPVMAPTRSYPLVVAQLSSFANLSRNYPLLFQIFHRSRCSFYTV